jgi:uncharacterized protein YdaU (DUF1376 family)
MSKLPYLCFWVDDWQGATHHLTFEQRGAYLDILLLMWKAPRGRIPNDPEWISHKLGVTAKTFDSLIAPLIAEFCQTTGNWITQHRLLQELERAAKRSQAQSVRSKARWNNKKPPSPPNADAAIPSTLTPKVTEESPPYPPQGVGSSPVSEWSEEQVQAFCNDHGYPPIYDAEFYGPGARRRRGKLTSMERLEAARARTST